MFVAIYNTQPFWTPLNKLLKRSYVRSGRVGKSLIAGSFIASQIGLAFVKDTVRLCNPLSRYRNYRTRGMSRWHDWIDWVGGYPFETATVDQICTFYHQRGFLPEKIKPSTRSGCSQFVLRKSSRVRSFDRAQRFTCHRGRTAKPLSGYFDSVPPQCERISSHRRASGLTARGTVQRRN